jgi:hypothetical protein
MLLEMEAAMMVRANHHAPPPPSSHRSAWFAALPATGTSYSVHKSLRLPSLRARLIGQAEFVAGCMAHASNALHALTTHCVHQPLQERLRALWRPISEPYGWRPIITLKMTESWPKPVVVMGLIPRVLGYSRKWCGVEGEGPGREEECVMVNQMN